ncbi:hypothetical protein RRG08_048902 [Elysia crispata]|uniref:Uncharacterized protein n=1 Tax=Elysia crispata TaxID=231223 RepID=A0AAE1D4A1_9GAST|nr:hypothetical protein RRG08_048902 [Elysia crispata]
MLNVSAGACTMLYLYTTLCGAYNQVLSGAGDSIVRNTYCRELAILSSGTRIVGSWRFYRQEHVLSGAGDSIVRNTHCRELAILSSGTRIAGSWQFYRQERSGKGPDAATTPTFHIPFAF